MLAAPILILSVTSCLRTTNLEEIVDAEVVLGRRFKEDGVDLLGKLLPLLQGDCPLTLERKMLVIMFRLGVFIQPQICVKQGCETALHNIKLSFVYFLSFFLFAFMSFCLLYIFVFLLLSFCASSL